MMIPSDRSPHSMRFPSNVSANSRSARIRSSTNTWRLRALVGSITHLAGSSTKPSGTAGGSTSPRTTAEVAWETRVVVRRKTGTSNRSESEKASLVYALASAESEGSSIGILAATA